MDDLSEAMRRYKDSLARAAAAVGAGADETVYDARQRNFERAAAEAKARDRAREAGR